MTSRLRILHVASHNRLESGGAVQMALAAAEMARTGHVVSAVVHERPGDPPATERFQELAASGCDVRSFPMKGLAAFGARARFRRLVREQGFDILHAHRERALRFVLAALAREPRAEEPAIVAGRGNTNPLTSDERRLLVHPAVQRVIAVARAVRTVLMRCGGPPHRIEVVYGGVDLARFRPDVSGADCRAALGIPRSALLVGVVANLDNKKAYGDFFEAALACARTGADVHFVIAGAGDFSRYRDRVAASGVPDRFHFLGFRNDIPAVLAALDVVVCSSTHGEGLTGSLREAMVMQKPVVSTAVGGNPEVIRDRETGLLVPPGEPRRLSAAILELLDDRPLGERLARAGRELMVTLGDNRRRVERLLAIYRDVLEYDRRRIRMKSIEEILHPRIPMTEAGARARMKSVVLPDPRQ